MAKKIISDEIRDIIIDEVKKFNQKELTMHHSFKAEIKGKFIYLKLNNEYRCRLKYDGDINNLNRFENLLFLLKKWKAKSEKGGRMFVNFTKFTILV